MAVTSFGGMGELLGVLVGIGLSRSEADGMLERLRGCGQLDLQGVRDGLQYLVLMRSDCAVDALRALGFSPLVTDVYRVGKQRQWIDEEKLMMWGFALVDEEACYSDDVDEYLVLVPKYEERMFPMGLVDARDEDYVCSTGARVGPACLALEGRDELVEEVSLETLPLESKTVVRESCVAGTCEAYYDPVGSVDGVVDKFIGVKSLQGVVSGLDAEEEFSQHMLMRHADVSVPSAENLGCGYLSLFKNSSWLWIFQELKTMPRIDSLIAVYAVAMRRSVALSGFALQKVVNGFYEVVCCDTLGPEHVLASMVLALKESRDAIVTGCSGDMPPLVVYSGHVAYQQSSVWVPGVVASLTVPQASGRSLFSVKSLDVVLVTIPSGAVIRMPGGQELTFGRYGARLVGLQGLEFEVVAGFEPDGFLMVAVGDGSDWRRWFHCYAGFPVGDGLMNVVCQDDYDLVVTNIAWAGNSEDGMVVGADEELDVVPLGPELRRSLQSSLVSSARGGVGFTSVEGEVCLSSTDSTTPSLLVSLAQGASIVVASRSVVLCRLGLGSEVQFAEVPDGIDPDLEVQCLTDGKEMGRLSIHGSVGVVPVHSTMRDLLLPFGLEAISREGCDLTCWYLFGGTNSKMLRAAAVHHWRSFVVDGRVLVNVTGDEPGDDDGRVGHVLCCACKRSR